MLFVLEDLHWADRQSLDLFDHVAFTVVDTSTKEPVPLVIIGTHRQLPPEERLSRLSARLQREDICRTITLGGSDLTGDAVVEAVHGEVVTWRRMEFP